MKNVIKSLVIVSILFLSVQANAQLRFGAQVGLNIAEGSLSPLTNGETLKSIMGFNIGGKAEYSLTKEFAIEGGLSISQKGAKVEMSNSGVTVTASINPLYLEIPINAVYKMDVGGIQLQGFAGPYLGFGIGGKISYTATGLPSGLTIDNILSQMGKTNNAAIKFGSATTDDMKGTDFGLNFGVGAEMKNIQVRLQYGLGLTNLANNSGDTQKNGVFSISVGYMFGGK